MDTATLRAYMKARNITQSELARRIGVSRQAVSRWFCKGGRVNVRADHLIAVGSALGLRAEDLVRPLPCFEPDRHRILRARYLWDRLFPDLDDFAIALNQRDARAVARLIEVDGVYAAEKIVGKFAWENFEAYRRHLHPVRRRQLEKLIAWHRQQSPIAA